jgi:hypothetical protein
MTFFEKMRRYPALLRMYHIEEQEMRSVTARGILQITARSVQWLADKETWFDSQQGSGVKNRYGFTLTYLNIMSCHHAEFQYLE